ncbi:MFS transporter [Weissella cibaria]|uniref:MFS transporter n=1 Tax=Weissella cibaria TaxID=137591 RepID=UPI001E5E51C9|nr:MFS transporter [Weissella cibaria]MCC6122224.1 MFS transporter [Weissella cibaria]MCT0954081.1 MFS transporter [Weissella cibaria]
MDKHGWLFKASLLSIATLTNAAAAVQVTVPMIMKDLPNQSQASIELLMSVTSFGILLFILLSNFLTRLIGNKKTVVLGVAIAVIAGVIPMFTENYAVLLASRFMFGAGVGLFNSLAISLISIYYEGKERDRLIGFENAAAAAATTIFTWLVGYLMSFGWHMTFGVYALGVIPLIMFGLFVSDKTPTVTGASTSTVSTQKPKLNATMIGYGIFMFILFVTYFGMTVKIAPLFEQAGYGTAAEASLISGISAATGFVAGVIFGSIKQILGRYMIGLGTLAGAVMVLVLSMSQNLILSGVAIAVYGLAFGMAVPAIYSAVAAKTDEASQNLGSTILLVAVNMGVFLSPYVFQLIASAFGDTSAVFSMRVDGLLVLALAVITLVTASLKKPERAPKPVHAK